jgi:hypothetical protein
MSYTWHTHWVVPGGTDLRDDQGFLLGWVRQIAPDIFQVHRRGYLGINFATLEEAKAYLILDVRMS